MAEAKRPLPRLHELDTQAFWRATKDHELRYQQCDDCDTVVFYPRRHCTGCLGNSLTWKTSSGQGTVYTYSIVRQSYHPFFAAWFRTRLPGSIWTKVRGCCRTLLASRIRWTILRSASVCA